jgi:regulator of sigma E protease
MISVIQTLLAFVLVIGILVTVHEFGHYWVAQLLGVKILRFSIGFGKPLWSRRLGKDKTEFVVATVPLGGYVKMLDEHEGPVAPEELHRAFNRQPLNVRTAIVIAGPLFNLVFAVFVYTLMFIIGINGMKAIVGEVTPESLAAQAQLRAGHEIIAVEGQRTMRWDSVIEATLQQLLNGKETITYSVQEAEGQRVYSLTLNLKTLTVDDIASGQFFSKLGIRRFQPPWPAIIGEIMPNSAAERAGLQTGDRILALDDQPIDNWNLWADYVSKHPEQEIKAKIDRQGEQLELVLRPDRMMDGKGRMGVKYVISPDYFKSYFATEHYPLDEALIRGMNKTWEFSVLTLKVMFKMLIFQVSPANISGPISIAEYAGRSAQLGIVAFLSFLGLVSVSLGVINLLPIPLLDGGHLLLYAVEFFKGHPVTESTEYLLQRVGLVLLLSLMGLAIFNDLGRLFS